MSAASQSAPAVLEDQRRSSAALPAHPRPAPTPITPNTHAHHAQHPRPSRPTPTSSGSTGDIHGSHSSGTARSFRPRCRWSSARLLPNKGSRHSDIRRSLHPERRSRFRSRRVLCRGRIGHRLRHHSHSRHRHRGAGGRSLSAEGIAPGVTCRRLGRFAGSRWQEAANGAVRQGRRLLPGGHSGSYREPDEGSGPGLPAQRVRRRKNQPGRGTDFPGRGCVAGPETDDGGRVEPFGAGRCRLAGLRRRSRFH